MKHYRYEVESSYPESNSIPPWRGIGGDGFPNEKTACFPNALLYGYSVYTTFRFPLEPFWLEAHLKRLKNNAAAFRMAFPIALPRLLTDLLQQQTHFQHHILRLTLYPLVEDFAGLIAGSSQPLPSELLLSVREAGIKTSPPSACASQSLQIIHYEKQYPRIKHGSLAEGFLLRREKNRETLWMNHHGYLTEASTANIFFLTEEGLLTPEDDSCLPGITRSQIFTLCEAAEIPCIRRPIHYRELLDPGLLVKTQQIKGCFLTNATQGIRQVDSISGLQGEKIQWTGHVFWDKQLRQWQAVLDSGGPPIPLPEDKAVDGSASFSIHHSWSEHPGEIAADTN